jgi:acetyl-CoA synthase
MCPTTKWCQKSVEVRGLKTTVTDIEIPCAFGPAFEGERVRGADLYTQWAAARPSAPSWSKWPR